MKFDEYSSDYDTALNKGLRVSGEDKNYFAKGRVDWLKKCLAQLNINPLQIMDYGCGTGTSVPFLLGLSETPSLVGLDDSIKSLEVAQNSTGERSNERSKFFHLDEYKPKGDIDLAFCNGVFHHIPPNKRPQAVDFIFRSLKPRGVFSLWENNPWNPGTRYVMSRIPFDRDAIPLSFLETKRLLKNHGFEILRVDFLFIMPNILRIFRGIEPFLRRAPLGAQYQVLARKI